MKSWVIKGAYRAKWKYCKNEIGLNTSYNGNTVQVIHHSTTDESAVLAEHVRLAEGFIARTLGLMGRSPLAPGEAMVFPFPDVGRRQIHTLFLRAAIDILWIEAERVTAKTTLRQWSLGETHQADTVIELPAGAAAAVHVGDIVKLAPETVPN